jgi:DNA repair exonuclease SbcCD ATPase subunit
VCHDCKLIEDESPMANTEKNELYVTELAGPDDRWLSVTDAARITRRQEKSIRDWVESGKLPVHPERVGLNKRTRQIRLSDLAKLTPIVDPEAGISTDVGLLDLPSIPKAQQRLTEQMTTLQQEVTGLAGQQEKFAQETRQIWGTHQEQYRALDRRDDELLKAIQQAREDWTANVQEVNRLLHGELDARIADQAQALQQVRRELTELVGQSNQALRLWITEQIGQSESRLRQDVATLSTRLGETEQTLRKELLDAVQELHTILADRDARWFAGLKELNTRLTTALQVRQIAHEQLQVQSNERHTETSRQIAQLAERATTFDGRLGGQETRTSQLETIWQQRAATAEKEARLLRLDLDNQVKTQQALQKQLDEERKARELLGKQVEKLLQQGQKKDKG